MLTANGALPMILTIILVHSTSYIRPVRPERKKHIRTKISMFLVDLCEIFFLAISCPDCFARERACSGQNSMFYVVQSSFSMCLVNFFQKLFEKLGNPNYIRLC